MSIASDEKLAAKLSTFAPPRSGKKPYALGEGLYLMVFATGWRYFARQGRNASGNPQMFKLGDLRMGHEAPGMGLTLHEARKALLAYQLSTFDERVAKAQERDKTKERMTFTQLRDEWLADKVDVRPIGADRKRRYRAATDAHFLNRPVPCAAPGVTWGELEVREFGGPQWHTAYEKTLRAAEAHVNRTGDKRGASTIAYQVDQFLQGMWKYAVRMEYIKHAHAPERLTDVQTPQAIERSLTVRELEHLFAVTTPEAVARAQHMNEVDACFLRLLALTGIRANIAALGPSLHRACARGGFLYLPGGGLETNQGAEETPARSSHPIDRAHATGARAARGRHRQKRFFVSGAAL